MNLLELCEALNTILPHQLIEDTPSRRQYGIAFKDTLFVLVFDLLTPFHAIVSFYEQGTDNQPEFGVTHKVGYAGHLFATIIKLLHDELEQLDVIAYTASGTSRQSLYSIIAKKYSGSRHVYIIPVGSVEVTVISRDALTTAEKQSVATTAADKLA